MAVTRDAVSATAAYYDEYTVSHTVASQNDRYLFVADTHFSWTNGITNITYAGVNMTEMAVLNYSRSGDNIFMTVWGLFAPATGTNSVQYTISSSGQRYGSVSSYYGVDQTLAYDSEGTAKSTDHSASTVLTAQTGGLIVAMGGCVCYVLNASSDNTEWFNGDRRHNLGYNEDYDNAAKTMVTGGVNCGSNPHANQCFSLQPPQNITIDMTGSEAIAA